MPSHSTLHDLGAALWDLQQQLHPAYPDAAEPSASASPTGQQPDGKASLPRRMLALPPSFPDELNVLQRLLPFPEEVALKLTETEHELFNAVPPVDYLRYCTTDLTARSKGSTHQPNGVPSLIKRFNEVACVA